MKPMVFALKYPREKPVSLGFLFLFLRGTFELFNLKKNFMVKLEFLG